MSSRFSMCCIMLGSVGQMARTYDGFLKKDDLLRSKLSTKFSFPTLIPFLFFFFPTWTASFGKILTLDSLCTRHIIVIDWCCMCKKCGESLDYLLHCDVVRDLWNMVFWMWIMP
jgi:hypothetical protein